MAVRGLAPVAVRGLIFVVVQVLLIASPVEKHSCSRHTGFGSCGIRAQEVARRL